MWWRHGRARLALAVWALGLASLLTMALPAAAQTTDPSVARKIAPGFWWSPALSGTGFAFQNDEDQLFFLSFHYETGGDATWAAATLTQNTTTPSRFDGRLVTVAGGPQMGEGAKPINAVTDLGAFRVDFTGPTAAQLTWPDGRTTAIMRYEIVSGGLSRAKVSGFPEPGIWWDSNVAGTGYSLDVQGTNIYFAGYFYRADGRPRWCLTGGVMDSTGRFTGNLFEYKNGTPLGGSYRPPAFAGTCGPIVLQVADPDTINMVVNNLPPVVLKRYQFSTRPRFPGLISATASDTTKIDLKWLPATAAGVPGNQISYQIFNLPAGQTVPVAANRLATVTGETATTLTGLSANTAYRLAIRAVTPTGTVSLDQSPVSVTTLRNSNTLLPGVTFSQPSQLGMVGATMAADGTITTSGQITIANGTIIAGTISNGTIMRRVTGTSFSAGVTTIRTTSVSLAEMFASVSVNANMKAIDGNTAARGLKAYYESLGITRTQGGDGPLDRLDRDFQSGLITWNGTQFVTDPQARMLPSQLELARTQAGILSPSWKKALLEAINARLELIGFAITDLDIEPKITPQLSLASATQFAVGSKVEAEIAGKIVIASSLTRNTVGRCSDPLILPSPLVPFLYEILVIPTPIGPLPVPWEMGGQVKVTCQITKLNIPVPGASALGLGAEAYEYKVTPKLEYTSSGWTFTGSETASKSFTGPSDPPTNDLEINAAAGVYAGAYLTLGKSANISLTSTAGLEARFPVVGGYEYEFDAGLKTFSPGLKEAGGSGSDTLAAWDRFTWRGKPQIEIEPVFQLFFKNYSPLKFTVPLGDPVTLFSLPTANTVVTPVNGTSARIDATFTNGTENNFDPQSPKWTVKSGTTGLSVEKVSSTRATATFDATNRELVYLLFNGAGATKLVAYNAVNPAQSAYCGIGQSPTVSRAIGYTLDDRLVTNFKPENRQQLMTQTAPQSLSSDFLIGLLMIGNGVDRWKTPLTDTSLGSLELNIAPSNFSAGPVTKCQEGYERRNGTVTALTRTCLNYTGSNSIPALSVINLKIPSAVLQDIRGSAFTSQTYTLGPEWGQSTPDMGAGASRITPSGRITFSKLATNGVPSSIGVSFSNFSFAEEITTRLTTGNVDEQVRTLTTAISSMPEVSYRMTQGSCR